MYIRVLPYAPNASLELLVGDIVMSIPFEVMVAPFDVGRRRCFGLFVRVLMGVLCSTHEIDGSECAVAANDVSLAYFGGQARSFLVLLAMFGGLTKIYSSAYFGGSAVQLGLVWWLGGFPGSLKWPSCLF